MSVRIDERSCDYSMSEKHAKALAGVTLLNLELRRLALDKIAKTEGPDTIVEMFRPIYRACKFSAEQQP